MSFASHEINHLIQVSPDAAREKLLSALENSGMHKGNTAKSLSCSHGTLLRWIKALHLEKKVAALTKKARRAGWFVSGNRGRPLGSTVANGAKPRPRRVKSI